MQNDTNALDVGNKDGLAGGPKEPRSKTLLRSMMAALDGNDAETFFACFDQLQRVTLEMVEPAQQPSSAARREIDHGKHD